MAKYLDKSGLQYFWEKIKSTMGDYVTPEMFGAKGDGETDDSEAFSDAIATGKPVISSNDYYLDSQLVLPFSSTLICYGTITSPNGVLLNSTDAKCYIKKLVGDGTGDGVVFEVPPSSENLGACTRNSVEVGLIDNFVNAIDFHADIDERGIQYNRVVFDRIIHATNAIRMRTEGTRTWVNQNQIIGGAVYGGNQDHIYTGVLGNADAGTEITSNKFESICFEGIEDAAIELTNCTGNTFIDCRLAEEIHGTYWVKLHGSGANRFSGYLNFTVAKILDEMASDWTPALAHARANRFDFYNLQTGTSSWQGIQGCWSFNNQFCVDYPGASTYSVITSATSYNFNTEFEFSKYNIGNNFKITMAPGGTLTLPCMFKSYMTELVVYNNGNGSITVKDYAGNTIGTISTYGNNLLHWTTGGLMILT